MPGPQSSVPSRVRPSKSVRRFTLAEANSALPLVKRVVGDVVRINNEAVELQSSLEKMTDARQQSAVQKELDYKSTRMNELVAELNGIGVELKDPAAGLVDFIGRHQGHDVYLCWKLGEDRISHWHELQSGFAGRKPVSSLEEGE